MSPRDRSEDADDRRGSAGGQRSARRPPWSEFRAALQAAGFRPSRRLGQNFLLDENLCRALVRDAEVRPGDRVVEVGAGCGFLTAQLAEAGARVLALEIDPRLIEIARGFLGPWPEVELVCADALAGKNRLAPELVERLPREGPWLLVANLPYAIAAPLLALCAELENPPARMSVLVQREVAERILARPASSERGPLAIKLQRGYQARRVREVPAALFWPRPKVQSSVVRLDRRDDPPGREEGRALDRLARGLFLHRRQGVGRVLGGMLGDREAARAALREVGIDPLRRPGELQEAELEALARHPAWRAAQAPPEGLDSQGTLG